MRFSKKIVVAVIILNIIAFGIGAWLYHEHGSEPSVLIGAWFAFTTGELWKLGDIKKIEKEGKKDENNS